ncbi:MAG: 4-hydroxy-tetrahydrodipicolinate reductase [Christensenellaceae bacterium]|jgi:4-hydroxy-tetrahydrodipicolinate reductase|nr:4-hydroxy-tetrahydrodipicolinate reductase [Christensenellaceae bacterium]
MTKILVNGALGKMGRMLAASAMETEGFEVVAGVDKYAAGAKLSFPLFERLADCGLAADVLIDFSRPDALAELLPYAKAQKLSLVLATTGYSKEQMDEVRAAAKEIPVFKTANMSIGVNVLLNLAKRAAIDLKGFDIEIIERHHNTKIDAPSGTALLFADGISDALRDRPEYVFGREGVAKREKDEIGIHAVRGGTLTGEHEIDFYGSDESVILSHHAASRRIFAIGALRAAEFITEKGPGLYDMQDLLLQNAGVTQVRAEVGQSLVTLPDAARAAETFLKMAELGVNIDMIAQVSPGGVAFTIAEQEVEKAAAALNGAEIKTGLVKLTAAGLGMEKQCGIAAGIFGELARLGLKPLLVTTSEIQVSILLKADEAERAASALHEAYRA